ncbi:MAG: hypothetical protein U9O94_07240 [Nanoarchaeota archaeon]|nr:hypothetical protein [Nanoarchaeota archaeon]
MQKIKSKKQIKKQNMPRIITILDEKTKHLIKMKCLEIRKTQQEVGEKFWRNFIKQ